MTSIKRRCLYVTQLPGSVKNLKTEKQALRLSMAVDNNDVGTVI